MEEEKRKAYSEVVEVLKLIEDEEKLEKIPFEVIQLIKENSDPTYKPEISKDIPLENQNLSKDTLGILSWISNKYWGVNPVENKEQEEKIDKDIEAVETVETEEQKEENKENNEDDNLISIASVYNDIDPESLDGRNLPALNMNWFQRLTSKIVRLFKTMLKIEIKNKKEGVNE